MFERGARPCVEAGVARGEDDVGAELSHEGELRVEPLGERTREAEVAWR